jgi:hypothetical protein
MMVVIVEGKVVTMGKIVRILIVFILIAGMAVLAGEKVAGADPAGGDEQAAQSGEELSPSPHKPDPGSVKPPPDKVKICKNGNFSVGGVSTLRVKRLGRDYCIIASLHEARVLRGSIPHGARILADVTLFRVMYRGHFVGHLPSDAGTVELCYAVPPGKDATIYLLNQGKHTWQPIPTTVKKGTACARVQTSGYYALIGK